MPEREDIDEMRLIAQVSRYARSHEQRARLTFKRRLQAKIRARIQQIVEENAQDIVSRQVQTQAVVSNKDKPSFYKRWKAKRWSWL